MKFKFNKYIVFLNILILFVLITNFIWLKKDTLPPEGNALQDLLPGINFYSDIANLNNIAYPAILNIFKTPLLIKVSLFKALDYIRSIFFIYPPLVPVSYSLFYILFGPSSEIELMANSLYLALALYSIYGIAKKIFNEKVGLLTTFIFSSFPGIISISREIYAEFFMMCLVALTLYLLLKTDFFRNRKYSLLLGISLGLTALAKWEFLPAIIGPFILVLWKSNVIAKKTQHYLAQKKALFTNFFLAIIIGILISSFWYLPSIGDVIWRLFLRPDENIFINNRTTWNTRLFSLSTVTYYPLTVINVHIRFFYFLLLTLIGTAFTYKVIKNNHRLFLIKEKLFYIIFLISWIVIPYICFTFIKIHAPSHIMVILPALSIIISAGISSFIKKLTRIVLTSLIILYGLTSYLHSFVFIKELEPFHNLRIYLRGDGKLTLITHPGRYMRDSWEPTRFYPPDNRNWKIREILSFIKIDNSNIKNKALVLVLSPHHNIQSFQFQYYNLLENYQLFIEPRGNDRSEFPPVQSKIDYIIIFGVKRTILNEVTLKLEGLVSYTPNIQLECYNMNEILVSFSKKYKLIKEYLLPDSSIAEIYKFTLIDF